jgi:hypothetical protein
MRLRAYLILTVRLTSDHTPGMFPLILISRLPAMALPLRSMLLVVVMVVVIVRLLLLLLLMVSTSTSPRSTLLLPMMLLTRVRRLRLRRIGFRLSSMLSVRSALLLLLLMMLLRLVLLGTGTEDLLYDLEDP